MYDDLNASACNVAVVDDVHEWLLRGDMLLGIDVDMVYTGAFVNPLVAAMQPIFVGAPWMTLPGDPVRAGSYYAKHICAEWCRKKSVTFSSRMVPR